VLFYSILDVWSASNRTLETDVFPPKNRVKMRRLVRLGRSLGRPTICFPDTK